jgi:hypothetical protein
MVFVYSINMLKIKQEKKVCRVGLRKHVLSWCETMSIIAVACCGVRRRVRCMRILRDIFFFFFFCGAEDGGLNCDQINMGFIKLPPGGGLLNATVSLPYKK